MRASQSGHLALVEYLVEKGADLQAANEVSVHCPHVSYVEPICECVSGALHR